MDKNHTECGQAFRHAGFSTRADVTAKWATLDDPGRSDYQVVRRGLATNVECKCADITFAFDDWRENQREWALQYSEAWPFSTPYWLFLRLGIDPPTYQMFNERKTPKKGAPRYYMPKQNWLIPMHAWLEIEDTVRPYQDSLPYYAGSGYRIELQDGGLDAYHLLAPYKLDWAPSNSLEKPAWFNPEPGETYSYGIWTIPHNHPFFQNERERLGINRVA